MTTFKKGDKVKFAHFDEIREIDKVREEHGAVCDGPWVHLKGDNPIEWCHPQTLTLVPKKGTEQP
jgi:hypothetical protein